MKVRMTVTLDIDTGSWGLAYGINSTHWSEIRADVISHVTNLIQETYVNDLEVATATTVKG